MIEKIKPILSFRVYRRIKLNLFGSKNYKKFVILTAPRSGSNLLVSFLNYHPEIEAEGELFAHLNGRTTIGIWKRVFSKRSRKVKAVGFKIFHYHPKDSDDKTVWELLKKDSSIKIIFLKRENMLRNYVSRLIAHKTKIWIGRDIKKEISLDEKKVELSKEGCLHEFNKLRKWNDNVYHQFPNHPIFELKYEDLSINPQKKLNEIFNFLELKAVKVKSGIKKQNPEKLKDLISNYNSLKKELAGTEYAPMFEE